MLKQRSKLGALGFAAFLGLSAAGCNSELSDACAEYCVERAACDREKGDTPSDTCESSCVQFEDDSFVDKAAKCKGKHSCEYAVCIAE